MRTGTLVLFSAFLVLAITGCATRETVTLLPESDGSTGELTVGKSGSKEASTLNEAFGQASVGGAPGSDANVAVADEEEVLAAYGDLLGNLPEPPVDFLLLFETDADTLTQESQDTLPLIERALTNRPLPIIEIVGHTDTVGTNPYNDALAERRAVAVRDALQGLLGADRADFRWSARGENDPAVATADQVPEAQNRRVEVQVRTGLGELNVN